MRRALPAVAAAAALAAAVAPGAGAASMPGMPSMSGMPTDDTASLPAAGVPIGFAAFLAPRVDVVSGDTVRWSNDSARAHDIVAGDGSFDSGRVYGGDTFQHRFETAGTVSYYCSLHPFMTGEVDVHDVLLDAPAQRAGSGKPYVLTGRVAAGGASTVDIQGDDGGGFAPVATAAVATDGTFRTTVVPRTTTSYRAVAGPSASPAVQLLVLDHAVALSAAATTLRVRVTPAAPGQRVVLQLRLHDRFGWWPVSSARLDARSAASFVVPRRAAVPARVLLTLRDGATELARSTTVRVGTAHHHH